ncbi:hypothetical protein BDW69DRAFT_186829 [Aspergillus filifer]
METQKLPHESAEPAVPFPSQEDVGVSAPLSTMDGKRPPPLLAKLFAVFLASCIRFGSHWSSGVTGAMKSTIKKQMNVSNTQFSLLEACEDFMATVLLLFSGVVTNRVGGAGMIVYGQHRLNNRVNSRRGSDNQHRQLRLGLLDLRLHDFTNFATGIFYFFTRYCNRRYSSRQDKATKEVLTEKSKRFGLDKFFQIPWMFWTILLSSLFQTSTALVFSQNSTELAEKRFNAYERVVAGGTLDGVGFFLVPILGVFLDILGNRASVLFACGVGIILSMVLVNFGSTKAGTAASFGVYTVASTFGPTSIIDIIRTTLWYQSVFGSAYALKVTMNNEMNIIVRIITGVLQDADNDSYDRVVRVYLFLAAASIVVGAAILIGSWFNESLAPLQWTRKKRISIGPAHIAGIREKHLVVNAKRNRVISVLFFGALLALVIGGGDWDFIYLGGMDT